MTLLFSIHSIFKIFYHPILSNPHIYSHVPSTTRTQSKSSQRVEGESKDCFAARKLQKVDYPDRPKNDKATILTDNIQLLKNLTSEVSKLKREYATLTEESRENQLTVEKNDLKEEKASLKSDIDNLNVQYQQRVGTMFQWPSVDYSVVLTPLSYPFPIQMAMPPLGAIPMHHPSISHFLYLGTKISGLFITLDPFFPIHDF